MPPPPCIVAFCKKNGSHNFPKDEPRRTQWIEAIEHKKPGLTIRKHSRICSDHFKPTDFSKTALALLQPNSVQKTLKKTAIPSIFPWKSAQQCTSVEDLPKFNVKNSRVTYSRIPPVMFVEEQPYLNAVERDLDVDPLNWTNQDYASNAQNISHIVDIEESDLDVEDALNLANQGFDSNEQISHIEESIAEELEISSLEVKDGLQEQLVDNIEKHEISVQTEEYYGSRQLNALAGGHRHYRARKMPSNIVKCNSCNIVINEVLSFIQNKIMTMDEDSLVNICEEAFAPEEILTAKKLLFDSVQSKKIKNHKKDKPKTDLEDIIELFKQTDASDPEKLPISVAKDLHKLPPVTFDHLDATRLLLPSLQEGWTTIYTSPSSPKVSN